MSIEEFCLFGINALLVAVRSPDDGKGRICLDRAVNEGFFLPSCGLSNP